MNHSSSQPLTRYEPAIILLISILVAAWAQATQSFQVFRYWDSDEYFLMAEQLAAGQTITAAAPYSYRVLTPWIVSQCCSANIQIGFLIVNVAAGVATALLLIHWLRQFTSSEAVRLLVVSGFVLHWIGPIRFPFYYPAYVDPVFQLIVIAALISGEWLRQEPSTRNGVLYALLVVLGTLGREIMLVVPLCALVAAAVERRLRAPQVAWQGTALAAGVVTYLAIRWSVDPRPGYSVLTAMAAQLMKKRPESLLLTWFLTFGPSVAVVVYDWRSTQAFLRRRLDLGLLLLSCTVLAYFGGTDTERLMFWSAPVVGMLVAQSIERHRRVVSSAAVAGLLVAGQFLASRILWPIPDPGNAVQALSETNGWAARIYAIANRVFVIDDFHWNLWSYFGSRPFHLVQLAFYLLLSAAVVMLMKRRATASQLTTA